MLEERLANLVYFYLKNNREIDKEFINQVIMISKEYYGLNDYILKVKNSKQNKNFVVYHDTVHNEIKTNVDYIYEEIQLLDKDFHFLNKSRTFDYIICILILLHGINFAQQRKKINEIGIESTILKEEDKLKNSIKKLSYFKRMGEIKKLKKLNEECFEYSPSNRLARIYSYETSSNLSLVLEDELTHDILEYQKLYSMLKGYNNESMNEPAKYYFNNINPENNYKEIRKLSKNLKVEEKIKYGFKLSKETLIEKEEQSKKMLKEMILKY